MTILDTPTLESAPEQRPDIAIRCQCCGGVARWGRPIDDGEFELCDRCAEADDGY